MPELDPLTQRIEETFTRIEQEQMKGIPLLNPNLKVQTSSFQLFEERIVGIVITPWLMNLILFPAEGEDWSNLTLGEKQTHRFPANEYRFMVNEFEGIGQCQTHSLHSPMHEFMDQDHAVAAAESFMQTLMVEVEHPEQDPHDEELLGRILRGEETPEIEMDGFALAEKKIAEQEGCQSESVEPGITRRDLLRGVCRREG
ncbi:MAG: [NiFe]-hydrogenase assembly chaperone HybE [Candidatus Thiodiazotropha sp. (ex Myrtea spinifera)]|nr:[NiFe]-hydrogenase assembly chaperone HybE [Candidatus Thiodiazotropha sp. (ex Myrtea spinifera)]